MKILIFFAKNVNEVFNDFSLNLYLTRQAFIPKQDTKIIQDIYLPVLSFLSSPKWEKVNNHFRDAFKSYANKDYSDSIASTVSAVQAYLQILVNGEVGKGNISLLISKALKASLIPDDSISKQVFNNIESIFAVERQEKSNAHPRIKEADEATARVLINLSMVFIQHCMQK